MSELGPQQQKGKASDEGHALFTVTQGSQQGTQSGGRAQGHPSHTPPPAPPTPEGVTGSLCSLGLLLVPPPAQQQTECASSSFPLLTEQPRNGRWDEQGERGSSQCGPLRRMKTKAPELQPDLKNKLRLEGTSPHGSREAPCQAYWACIVSTILEAGQILH